MSELETVETITIQNVSNKDQTVFVSDPSMGLIGQRFTIAPGVVQTLPVGLAQLFLEDRKGFVVTYTPQETPNIPGEPIVWLANGTGNPMLPKKVKMRVRYRGEYRDVEQDNPMLVPRELQYEMYGGQQTVTDENGETKSSVALLPKVFKIPPFRRIAVSASYARWLQGRNENNDPWATTMLFPCRGVAAFEPSFGWELDLLRAYAECIGYKPILDDPEIFGKPESEYTKIDPVTEAEVADERAIMEQRDRLMRALFFVVADPSVSIPKEVAFRMFLRERGYNEEITVPTGPTIAGVPPPTPRKRGRPPGSRNKVNLMGKVENVEQAKANLIAESRRTSALEDALNSVMDDLNPGSSDEVSDAE